MSFLFEIENLFNMKILKYTSTFFLVWLLIGLFSYLSYYMIFRPVIEMYDEFGWQGALFAIIGEVVIYSLIFLIIIAIEKLIDFVAE